MGFDEGARFKYKPRGPGRVYGSGEAALAEQKRIQAILEGQILPAAQYESAVKTERKVSRRGPRDTGQFRESWEVNRKLTSAFKVGGVTSTGKAIPRVELINTAPYSGVIERGARPFWPPLEPLIEWARRKAGDLAIGGHFSLSPRSFRRLKSGSLRYRGSASLNEEDDAAVVAFAKGVQKKIAAKGLPAHWIMRSELDFATRAVARATTRMLKELAVSGGLKQ